MRNDLPPLWVLCLKEGKEKRRGLDPSSVVVWAVTVPPGGVEVKPPLPSAEDFSRAPVSHLLN